MPASKPDSQNLNSCTVECKRAALDSDAGPKDPTDYSELRGRLEASKEKLPPLYREKLFTPYANKLEELGSKGFNEVLLNDPSKESEAGLLLDIAQAILQNGEGYDEKQTDAFQEVISDLYDGFLSAEDRAGVKPPDFSVIAPLAKWGRPDFGPYTWPGDAVVVFGAGTGVVNMPPANATHGLFAWAALAHETAGHDILSADDGLAPELAQAVRAALKDGNVGDELPDYWANRIDETASDVMGMLNMGPAVGIGLIGYFRGLNAAYTKKAKLRNQGPLEDPHPADILRGYLAASVVRRLNFDDAEAWAKIIEKETDNDVTTIRIGWTIIDSDVAKKSAEIVAETLVRQKMQSLENHALGDIQDWGNQDEEVVLALRALLTTSNQLPDLYAKGVYAAHVVAAAVMEALTKDADIPMIFDRMQGILKIMHDANSSWGPLYVEHPGDLVTRRSYIPHEED